MAHPAIPVSAKRSRCLPSDPGVCRAKYPTTACFAWLNSGRVGTQLSKDIFAVYLLPPRFPPSLGGQENPFLELSESSVGAGVIVRVITRRARRAVPAAE